MEQKYIKLLDVAQKFGVTRQTIRNWIEKGLLAAVKIDNSHYVTLQSVKAIEDKFSAVVVQEGALEAYLTSLNTLAKEYEKSVKDYRSAITGNESLARTRYIIARFIPIVYDLLCDGLPTSSRGDLVLQRVIEGTDMLSISRELCLTPERVRQILEKEMRSIREKASTYHALIQENAKLEKENTILRLNAKNIEEVVDKYAVQDVPDNILTIKLVDCNLSVRALNCLNAFRKFVDGKYVISPIETIGDLTRVNKIDLLKQRNLGNKTLMELDKILRDFCLEWGKRYVVQDGKVMEISSTI